jgi:hypothetical protein
MGAWGRNLADFIIPVRQTLPAAEQKLRVAAARGVQCALGATPAHWTAAESAADIPPDAAYSVIRASFLRFLLLGGDDAAPVHESGIQLSDAWIAGVLDLNECVAARSLHLSRCILDSGVLMTDASLINFALVGCVVRPLAMDGLRERGIFGERMKASGAVFISAGSHVLAETRMQAVSIDGDLDLSGTRFDAAVETALDLTAARIGGDLELNNYYAGVLPQRRDPNYHPPIRKHFDARGRVLLDNATIGVRLRTIGASMAFARDVDRDKYGAVLSCVGATVKGGLFFHNVEKRQSVAFGKGIEGVSLLGAKVGTLVDDLASWETGTGRHRFDGFVYDRIADECRQDDRSAWLAHQLPSDLGVGATPAIGGVREQPWRQAAIALEASGETAAARELRIEQQRRKTRSGSRVRKLWALPWDFVSRYGLSKGRLVVFTLGVWLVSCAAIYGLAARGLIYAIDEKSLAKSETSPAGAYRKCFTDPKATVYWLGLPVAYCAKFKSPNYAPFYPLLSGIDNLVPVIDLGQKKAWTFSLRQPLGWLLLFEYLWGAVIGSALAALLGSYLLSKPN